ncbi:MAG: pH regulation protein F [Firmicutes bacterium]|nr:pH regulation protein F [Bacillota bacterium]
MIKIISLLAVIVLIAIIALMLGRALRGPTVFNRMNALGVINADATLLIVLFGYIDGRIDMYVDIAISYAILGFVGSIAIAKYLGGKKL